MLWNWFFWLTFMAYRLTLFITGARSPMRIMMMLITVSSSTIVNALFLLDCLAIGFTFFSLIIDLNALFIS
jgi:hypothetical protein